MGLSKKQRAFVEHYLQCWNAGEAARRAGYSERSAYEIGYENLRKPQIASMVEQRINALQMQSDEVLARLTAQARGSMAEFVEVRPDGGVDINLTTAQNKRSLHLIKKIKKTTRRSNSGDETTIEIELYDSQAALAHLARILGMNNNRVQVDWRIEFEQAGIDPDAVESELVAEFERHLRAGASRAIAPGAGNSQDASRGTTTD